MNRLFPGSVIGIAATARFIEPELLAPFKAWLEEQGFGVVYASNIGKKYHQLAGGDEERAQAFQALLNDEHIDAIWVARGGYGTSRILPFLQWNTFFKKPKWIIGFSDITILHQWLASNHIPSVHAEMPFRFHTTDRQNFEYVLQILTQGKISYTLPAHVIADEVQSYSGRIIGGNLSLLAHLVGTPFFKPQPNDILLIEDLEEYLYHIDRMLWQLVHSGYYKDFQAVLVGDFLSLKDNEVPFGFNIEQILKHSFCKPIIQGLPIGHGHLNLPFIHGANVNITLHNHSISFSQNL